MKKKIAFIFLPLFVYSCAKSPEVSETTLSKDDIKLIFDNNPKKLANKEVQTSIEGHNLSLNDAVDLLYYVKTDDESYDDEGLLLWKSFPQTYSIETAEYILKTFKTETIGSTTYNTYCFDSISAKEMSMNIYAVSYVLKDNTYYYSEPDKYSILQYCFNKKDSKAKVDENSTIVLKDLIKSIVDYGANAQRFFNFNTTRLMDSSFHEINTYYGTFSDGFTKGLYSNNEIISLGDGFWIDSLGVNVSNNHNVVFTEDFPVTSFYVYDENKVSVGLDIDNGELKGLGTCQDSNVYIPKSVDTIGEEAFQFCEDIESIILPPTIKKISKRAFTYCSSLKSIIIPDSVNDIGEEAFLNCTSLETVKLPTLLSSINKKVFSQCSMLKNIRIPNKVEYIDEKVFENCTSLKSIFISASVYQMRENAFLGCGVLEEIIVDENNRYYYSNNCNGIFCKGMDCDFLNLGCKNTIIPANVKVINDYAFYGCQITEIIIPSFIEMISAYAFSKSRIESIKLPDSVERIEKNAFDSCPNLSEIELGKNTYYIGDEVFANLSRPIEKIYIPQTLRFMGSRVFKSWTQICSVFIDPNASQRDWNKDWNDGCYANIFTDKTYQEYLSY